MSTLQKFVHRAFPVVCCMIVGAAASLPAEAAVITWETPQTISGDSDVSTTGSLIYAYNVGPNTVSPSTVNGVTFAAFAYPVSGTTVSVGDVTFTESTDHRP